MALAAGYSELLGYPERQFAHEWMGTLGELCGASLLWSLHVSLPPS